MSLSFRWGGHPIALTCLIGDHPGGVRRNKQGPLRRIHRLVCVEAVDRCAVVGPMWLYEAYLYLPLAFVAVDLCNEVLKEARQSPADVTDVILVGGSSRIPYLQDKLKELFSGREPRTGINPDEAVAVGAALYADALFNLADSAIRSTCVLNDVTSVSLGVATVRDGFSVIVPRNSPIPISISKDYTTARDNQVRSKLNMQRSAPCMSTVGWVPFSSFRRPFL